MGCAAPIRARKAADGRLLFFKRTDKEYHIEPYTGLAIPCGTCILCREEQARQQAVRIAHEATCHAQNSFLTLTYHPAFLPQYGSLQYDDLEKFWKRLRKHIGTLRYYAVGEYGDRFHRPHYHACLFGHDFTEGAVITQESPHRLWVNPMLTRCWGLGDVKIGALTFETARYTASYVTKKLRSKQQYVRIDETTGELIAVAQPQPRMSRNLGRGWGRQYGHQLIDRDYIVINGKRQKPPKAYDKWMAANRKDGEIKIQRIKEERQKKARAETKEQTRARARNAHARTETRAQSV